MRKSLLCRLGLHRQLYRDGAVYSSADRCGVCDDWIVLAEGEVVESERAMWESGQLGHHRPGRKEGRD